MTFEEVSPQYLNVATSQVYNVQPPQPKPAAPKKSLYDRIYDIGAGVAEKLPPYQVAGRVAAGQPFGMAKQQVMRPYAPEEIDRITAATKKGGTYGAAIEKARVIADRGSYMLGSGATAMGRMMPVEQLISHEGAPDLARVSQYQKAIREGKNIDPLKIVKQGEKFAIEDGKHRYQAYMLEGHSYVPVQDVTEEVAARAKASKATTPQPRKKDGKFDFKKSQK